MLRSWVALGLAASSLLLSSSSRADELVRIVRMKISAGDVASGEAAIEDYKRKTGVDTEYLNALGWLARGAELLRRPEKAAALVALLHREIPKENAEYLVPYGAAIEVEGRLIAAREGRGAAIRFWTDEQTRAKDVSLQSRIRKNINLVSLEGQPAPEIGYAQRAGSASGRLAELRGKPALLFIWAAGCGDCKAQGPTVERIMKAYGPRGLTLVAPTRLYGPGKDGKPATPAEEKQEIEKAWAETFPGLAGSAVPIDTDTMVRYGGSATPTFVLVDRRGIVRLYAPTRLSEAELSRRIDEVLNETP
ncbi:MAG: TlpA disulfide reductase family protein [Thermoanaerobaculia bacterium]